MFWTAHACAGLSWRSIHSLLVVIISYHCSPSFCGWLEMAGRHAQTACDVGVNQGHVAAGRRARSSDAAGLSCKSRTCRASLPSVVKHLQSLGWTGIDVKLKTRVTSVDIKGKSLEAEAPGPRQHHVTWDHLIIATGAKVRLLIDSWG